MIKKRLFTPGPVSLYPPALSASMEANIHHRTPEFKAILHDVMNSMNILLGKPSGAYMFASSGSGAMEAAVTNFFSPGDPVLVASCGKFGERWIELTQRFGLQAEILKYEYGTAVKIEDVEIALKKNPAIRGVFLQACESSTGVQNDVREIAGVVSRSDALMVVDAVSALATMPLEMSYGIDVMVSGSQKALMIPPGLAFLAHSDRAWSRVESAKTNRFYFDLRAARKAWDKDGQTAFTPPTSLILSLQSSARAILDWGLDRLIELTENRARATRAGLKALSLELFPKSHPANALTAVSAPDLAEKITSHMKSTFGFHLAGGQGEMKGKIFRISHMGYIDHFDILGSLSALELTLKSLGKRVQIGSALQAFQEVYSEVV